MGSVFCLQGFPAISELDRGPWWAAALPVAVGRPACSHRSHLRATESSQAASRWRTNLGTVKRTQVVRGSAGRADGLPLLLRRPPLRTCVQKSITE